MFPNTYNVTRLLLAKLSQVARVLDFSSINWFELVQVLWTKFKAGATNRWKCWSEAFLKRKRNRLNEQGFLPNKRNPKPNKLNNQPFVEQVQTKLVFELNEGAISANEAEKTWTNRVFLNKSFHSETMTKFGGLVANKTLFDERFKIWPVSMTCSLNKTYQGGKPKISLWNLAKWTQPAFGKCGESYDSLLMLPKLALGRISKNWVHKTCIWETSSGNHNFFASEVFHQVGALCFRVYFVVSKNCFWNFLVGSTMGFTHLLLLFGRKLCSFWVVNNGLRTKLENFPTKQCFLQRRRKKSRLQKRVQGWNPNFKILSTMISPRVEPQKFIRIFTVYPKLYSLSEVLQFYSLSLNRSMTVVKGLVTLRLTKETG